MDSITINFNGNCHINISTGSMEELAKPAATMPKETPVDNVAFSEGYQALVSAVEDFLNGTSDEYDLYDDGAEDEDIDSIVVVMRPGEAPDVMTDSECYEQVEQFGEFCSVLTINDPDICAFGLKAAYDPRAVLKLGGDRYLVGPVIVYSNDCDGDSISLDAEEVMAAIVYFTDHTVTLCADSKDFPAFQI